MNADQKLDLLIEKVNKLECTLDKLTQLQEKIDHHESRLDWLQGRLLHVQRIAEYNEGQDKRMNLIFTGVPEAVGHESWNDVQSTIKKNYSR